MWSCPKNEVYPKYPQIHPNPLVNHHCHIHTTLDVLGVQFWFAPIFYHRGLELSVSPATGAGGTSGNLPQVSPWKKQKRAINARIIGSLSPESEFDQQKCGLTQYTMIGPYTNIDVDTNGHTPKHQFKWPSKSYRFEMFRSLPHLDVGILRQHIMFEKKTDDTGNIHSGATCWTLGTQENMWWPISGSQTLSISEFASVFQCFYCF